MGAGLQTLEMVAAFIIRDRVASVFEHDANSGNAAGLSRTVEASASQNTADDRDALGDVVAPYPDQRIRDIAQCAVRAGLGFVKCVADFRVGAYLQHVAEQLVLTWVKRGQCELEYPVRSADWIARSLVIEAGASPAISHLIGDAVG